jgi:transcription elongation factor GreA
VRSRIEVVITSLTRNQVVGFPARGFKSHRLRSYYLSGSSFQGFIFIYQEKKMGERLTKTDVEKIEKEIYERKVHTRHELIDEVKEARAQGDLSENFEYYAAKKAKNQNESRIRYLERMLKTSTIIDDASSDDEVGINNTVTIYFPEDDMEETYKLTTSIRSDSMSGRLDIESPLGKALLHHKVNDTVSVQGNDNYSYDVVIRNIDKSSTDDDDIRSF